MKTSLSNNRAIKWVLGNPKDEDEEEVEDGLSPWERIERSRNQDQNTIKHDLPESIRNSIIHFPRRNIWIGTSNFTLMESDLKRLVDHRGISKVEGLEILKFPGSCTMVVGVAYMFDEKKVLRDLEKALKIGAPIKKT